MEFYRQAIENILNKNIQLEQENAKLKDILIKVKGYTKVAQMDIENNDTPTYAIQCIMDLIKDLDLLVGKQTENC